MKQVVSQQQKRLTHHHQKAKLSLDFALGSDSYLDVAFAFANALLAVLDVDGLGHFLALLDHDGLLVSALHGRAGGLLRALLGGARGLLGGTGGGFLGSLLGATGFELSEEIRHLNCTIIKSEKEIFHTGEINSFRSSSRVILFIK